MKLSLRFVLILTALVAAAILVLAVACGGDDDEEGPAAGETPAAAEETPEGPPPSDGGETPAAAEETPEGPPPSDGELPEGPPPSDGELPEGPPPSEGEPPEGPPPGEVGELPDISAYPGAEEVFTGTFTGGGGFPIPMIGEGDLDPEDYGSVQYTVYETSDSADKVIDFYKDEFKDWKEEWTFGMEEGGQQGEIVIWSKDDAKLAAWLSAFEDDGTTSVIVAMGTSE
jgi:hypothetical protein